MPLTQSILAQGSCSNASCNWQVKSLGPDGFVDTITDDISWNIFDAPQSADGFIHPGYSNDAIATNNGLQIKPYYYRPNSSISNEPIQFLMPGSTDWQSVTLPLSIPQSQPVVLSDDPTAKIWGGCSQTTGICDYKVASTLKLLAMPWGDEEHPNCEGFTEQELSLINWNNINMSDVTGSMPAPSLTDEQKAAMQSGVQSNVQSLHANIDFGGILKSSEPNDQGNVTMQATPLEGNGPFDVTLILTSYWPNYIEPSSTNPKPNNDNPVSHVMINWGDGQTTLLTRADIQQKDQTPIFKTVHTYGTPPHQNVTETITATFFTQTGVYTSEAYVQNVWDTPSDDTPEGGRGADSTKTIRANQAPSFGNYNAAEVGGTPVR